MMTEIDLAYGSGTLPLTLDSDQFDITTILPQNHAGLPDPRDAFLNAVQHPIESPPLSALRNRCGVAMPKITIVIADHTRPVPDDVLIPWIVEELGVPDSCITILIGTGSHRPSTGEEILQKLGSDTAARFTIVNHESQNTDNLVQMGTTACGTPCFMNRLWVDADIRIATGFIEPHFFAGFSGGAKSIMPGISGLQSIQPFHRAALIADPQSTWSILDTNPTQLLAREMAGMCHPHFIVNVTLNLQREITGIFAGDMIAAHAQGCKQARHEATVELPKAFPVVVTTNSGYPLDQNFYQAVKGMSAAVRIVQPGGVIVMASECRAGLPSEGEFEPILSEPLSSPELLEEILHTEETRHDQWEVQTLLQILDKARVMLYSDLPAEKRQHIRTEVTENIDATLQQLHAAQDMARLPIAVLPMGPLTIPTLA
jgi:lactate racemase